VAEQPCVHRARGCLFAHPNITQSRHRLDRRSGVVAVAKNAVAGFTRLHAMQRLVMVSTVAVFMFAPKETPLRSLERRLMRLSKASVSEPLSIATRGILGRVDPAPVGVTPRFFVGDDIGIVFERFGNPALAAFCPR
jgi:hypothetical protein